MILKFKNWLELTSNQPAMPLNPQQMQKRQQANQSIAQASKQDLASLQRIKPNMPMNDINKTRTTNDLVQKALLNPNKNKDLDMKDLASSARDMVSGLANEAVPGMLIGAVKPAKAVSPMGNPFGKKNPSGVVLMKKMKK